MKNGTHIQLNKVKQQLAEVAPYINIDESCANMIIAEQDKLHQFFREENLRSASMKVEIFGQSVYHFETFEVLVEWHIDNADYHGVLGVMPINNHSRLTLNEVFIFVEDDFAHLMDQNKFIDDEQAQDMLKQIFSNDIQSWKTHTNLVCTGMQPTHLKKTVANNSFLESLKISDINSIPILKNTQLKKAIHKAGLKHLKSFCYHENITSAHIAVLGFSTYQIGEEKENQYLHLHWVVRSKTSTHLKLLPPVPEEVALIESQSIPGISFTGLRLTGFDGEPMSIENELMTIMNILNNDQFWIKEAIQIFADHTKEQRDLIIAELTENVTQESFNDSTIIQTSKKEKKLTTRGQNKRNIKQRDMFEKITKTDQKQTQEFTKYALSTKDGNPITFNGSHLASVTKNKSRSESKSENENIATTLDLYITQDNQWIYTESSSALGNSSNGNTTENNNNKNNTHNTNNTDSIKQVKFFSEKQEIVDFIGESEIGKELLKQANIIL